MAATNAQTIEAIKAFYPVPDRMGYTALHFAARHSSSQVLAELIRENPELLNSANLFGKTPLGVAAERGKLEAMRLLLASGARPRRADMSPAVNRGKVEACQLLIQSGAEVWSGHLNSALSMGFAAMIPVIVGAGVNVDALFVRKFPEFKFTALAIATCYIQENRLSVVRALLEAGADPDKVGDFTLNMGDEDPPLTEDPEYRLANELVLSVGGRLGANARRDNEIQAEWRAGVNPRQLEHRALVAALDPVVPLEIVALCGDFVLITPERRDRLR